MGYPEKSSLRIKRSGKVSGFSSVLSRLSRRSENPHAFRLGSVKERTSRGASAEFRTCLLSLRTPKEGSGFGEWVKETLPLLPVPRAVGAFSQPNISVATIENWYYSLSFHQLWGNAVLPRDASYFKAGTDNLSKKRT